MGKLCKSVASLIGGASAGCDVSGWVIGLGVIWGVGRAEDRGLYYIG